MAALPDTSPRLQSSFAKWPGLLARLSLTFHLINVAGAKLTETELPYLPESTALMVANYMQDILLPNLLRADTVMYSTAQTGHAKWIAGYILARKLEEITTRDVIRAYRDLQSPESRDELNSVMASLVAVSWLEPVASRRIRTPRPANIYLDGQPSRSHHLRRQGRPGAQAEGGSPRPGKEELRSPPAAEDRTGRFRNGSSRCRNLTPLLSTMSVAPRHEAQMRFDSLFLSVP
jgi:hypothetical protein